MDAARPKSAMTTTRGRFGQRGWLFSGGRVWIVCSSCGARLRALGDGEAAAIGDGPPPRCTACARAAADAILGAAIGGEEQCRER